MDSVLYKKAGAWPGLGFNLRKQVPGLALALIYKIKAYVLIS